MNVTSTNETIAQQAISDHHLLTEILNHLLSKNDEVRSKNYETILFLSINHPQYLYKQWDFFVDLLSSKNHYHRYIAINILSNLASVDTQNKFDSIFNLYVDQISSRRTMIAGQAIMNAGKIAKSKFTLQQRITDLLLHLDKIYPGKHTDLMNAYAIQSFQEFFDQSNKKNEIINFAKQQLESTSPKTRKYAKNFLDTHAL